MTTTTNEPNPAYDIPSLIEAQGLLKQVDALFNRAGLYESETGFACTYGLRDLMDDLDIDIDRIKEGNA